MWLPEGNPESTEAREIEDVGEEVIYTLPNTDKRKTKQHESISRFALWILRSKAKEITKVFEEKASEILVED